MVPVGKGDQNEVIIMEGQGGGDRTVTAATTSKASRSHSEAERKRRQRINGHLATLRTLLPAASRMDKAALLGEVVRHVRELRCKADDMTVGVLVPNECDEVGVEGRENYEGDEASSRVKAWVCCADRPGLMSDLSRAVRSVRARAVRAEMATVGGRTRSVVEVEMVEMAGDDHGRAGGRLGRLELQSALRTVLFNRDGVGLLAENYKRPRLSSRQ
ncbi:Basic helix-loop-helix (bHLH) DNA-binding family protein [Rhynchospora pubera]|uniref:Basic helix-loop-helix (BHLH) DNA-binding family protein n=1 Tax=Rhynchospora pubera TaxID=906938 RepID=A0AAV8GGU8_9POAL|nr:Basic helix-loop-helix (bHLH) DNA-binding family protein [Rhynchospora pubera]